MTVMTDHTLDYDEAVRVAKSLDSPEGKQWVIGDLADRLEPRYGEHTLQHFAADIGVEVRTVQKYRKTVRAYSPEKRLRSRNWSVAHELANEDDREELIEKDLTMREARQIVAERKTEALDQPEPCADNSCIGKGSVNPIPSLLKNVREQWAMISKSRRLKESQETLEQVEEQVGKMFADLSEIRRKYHS